MERAAVDRKARAVSLQDELNATAKEIEHGHKRGGGTMTGNPGLCGGELASDEWHRHFGDRI
jgi:hypothetical protein